METRKLFTILAVAMVAVTAAAAVEAAGCPPAGPTWDIPVTSAHVTGSFLLNGQPFPASFLQGANFFLRNASGDEVYLGLSNDGGFDRRIVPGTYDVVYEHKVGSQVPLNPRTTVLSSISLQTDTDFDINVTAIGVSGSFSLNGAPFPNTAYESATISLRDPKSDTLVPLNDTYAGAYAIQLIPGFYDVVYEFQTGGSVVPKNTRATILRDVSLQKSQTWNVDVPSVHVTGAILVNGAPPPATAYDTGLVLFLDTRSDDSAVLRETMDQSYDVHLVPGTYDVGYQLLAGGDSVVPANRDARVPRSVAFLADATYDIDIPSIHVYGDFSINGEAPPATAYENGYLWLRAGDDSVVLGVSNEGSYSKRILPGTYDVEWQLNAGGSLVPRNQHGHVATKTFLASTIYDLDVPMAHLLASVTVNGVPYSLSSSGTAILSLEDPASGEIVLIPAVGGSAAGNFVKGKYHVLYSHDGAPDLPINSMATLKRKFSLLTDKTTTIDIPARSLGGAFSLDGTPFPDQVGESGAIELFSTRSEDALTLGGTQSGGYSVLVLPGEYEARYNWYAGSTVPRNQLAPLGCARIP
jgi:hypothetical protein